MAAIVILALLSVALLRIHYSYSKAKRKGIIIDKIVILERALDVHNSKIEGNSNLTNLMWYDSDYPSYIKAKISSLNRELILCLTNKL